MSHSLAALTLRLITPVDALIPATQAAPPAREQALPLTCVLDVKPLGPLYLLVVLGLVCAEQASYQKRVPLLTASPAPTVVPIA